MILRPWGLLLSDCFPEKEESLTYLSVQWSAATPMGLIDMCFLPGPQKWCRIWCVMLHYTLINAILKEGETPQFVMEL